MTMTPRPRTRPGALGMLAVLGPIAFVGTLGGAFGTHYALGSAKVAKPKPTPTVSQAPPASFTALPDVCTLVPKATITPMVPAQQAAKNSDTALVTAHDTGNNPKGSCTWETMDGYNGANHITAIAAVDLHPTTAQLSGIEDAQNTYGQQQGEDNGKAGRTVKDNIGSTETWSTVTQVSGLGDQAYQVYYTSKDLQLTGVADLWIRRGNVVIVIEVSGAVWDTTFQTSDTKALPEATARADTLTLAHQVIPALNSCTACATP